MDGIIPELADRFKELEGCCICFSGGLDSTVLLRNAVSSIPDRFRAVFVRLPMNSQRQIDTAAAVADSLGTELEVLNMSWDELEGVERNDTDRCYICKRALYSKVRGFCEKNDLEHIISGDNADDDGIDRPGMRAGIESGIISPLRELGIGRDRIIAAVKEMDLPVPMIKDTCMATRYPVGCIIDEEALRFAENCESIVRTISGVTQIRVRLNGGEALLQTDPSELGMLRYHFSEIESTFMMKGLTARIDENCYRNR